jgi:hypothetical protein
MHPAISEEIDLHGTLGRSRGICLLPWAGVVHDGLAGLQHEIDELVDLGVAAAVPDDPCTAVAEVATGKATSKQVRLEYQ